MWTWGKNSEGELGIGTSDTAVHAVPQQVLGSGGVGYLTSVAGIAAAYRHTSAVKSDGTVWNWGQNTAGELGNGDSTQTQRNTPVQVVGPGGVGFLTGVASVQGGDGFGTALKSDGTVWAWGWNFYGALGQGTSDSNVHAVPVQVLGQGGVGYLTGIAQPGPCNAPTQPETAGGTPIDEKPTTSSVGNYPVNPVTGNFWHQFTDIAIPGRGLPLLLTRTYNSQNASQNGPLGFGWTHGYNVFLSPDPNKTLSDPTSKVTIHDENGAALVFSPSGSGNYQASSRVLDSLQLNAGVFQLNRRDQTHLFFNTSGQLTQKTDRNAYATTLSYTGNLLTKVTEPAPGGRSLTFAYNAALLQTVTDVASPAARSVSFKYDASGNLQFATDLVGNTTQFGYDANHQLTTMMDPRLGSVTNFYDTSGRVYQQQDPMNRFTKYSYDTPGFTLITDPKGNVTQEEYAGNEIVRTIRGVGTPQQISWVYGYDPVSLGISFVFDPAGNEWRNTWDSRGNLLTSVDPLGETWTYTYYLTNDMKTAQDPLMKQNTTYLEDSHGNITSSSTTLVETGQPSKTTYAYDPSLAGDLTSVTDPDLNVWTYAYDQYGVRNKAVDPMSDTTTYTHDNVGRLTAIVSPRGNVLHGKPASFTTTYTPDAFGRPSVIADPLGHQTLPHYDADGNVDRVTDANNHVTLYTYNADNQLTDEQRPDSSHLGTGYDADGNVSSQTDGLKNSTNYAYDSLNRLQSVTDPLNRTTSYQYDPVNEKVIVTDPQARTTTYQYDSANRLHGIVYSDPATPGVGYTYDADGQRQTMTDGTGTSTYTVDSLHRLTKVVGPNQAVSYGYDLKGQLTSITYPGGTQTVARGYDAAGRLSTVTDWNTRATTYGYDADSNATSVKYPNSTTATLGYDDADRLTSITDAGKKTTFLSLTYSPDPIGQTTTESSLSYGYSPINQLSGAGTTSYSYDPADNLQQVAISGSTTTTLADDTANQLSTFTKMNGSTQVQKYTYGYDLQGNRITRTDQNSVVTRYTFDQANRLTGYGSGATYAYNGDGLRMSKTVATTTTQQTWDVEEGLPLLLQDGTTSYVTGLGGLPLEQITSNGTTSYYHQDRIGSTRAITNASGSVVSTYAYDAYGSVTGSTGTLSNPFQYAGQYTDAESGLQYDRARYYDPNVGAFISRDPASSTTRQPYGYAANSPVNGNDPSGLIDVLGGLNTFVGAILNSLSTPAYAPEYDLDQLTARAQSQGVGAALPALNAAANVAMIGSMLIGVGDFLVPFRANELLGAVEESTALVRWDPDFAAKQLLDGNNVTAGGRTITWHAADRIVNSGRGIPLSDIDSVLDNGVQVKYNPLAKDGPTLRVFDATGRSVVVDAETGMRVVTVIP
jgi:RHS repeat-associated protein